MELFRLLGTVALEGTDQVKKDLSDTSESAKDASEVFEKTADKIASWSATIATATAAAASAIGSVALGSATNLEQAFNSFSAATGIASDELSEYKEVLQEIYADNYGENFQDIADSMSVIAQSSKDISPENVKKMTENALLLRDTFDMEVNESMRAANMLMDQFNVTGEEAFNMIAQGAQQGLNKNGDLLDSINEYAVHYKQMGYSAKDFFNSLKNGTDAGTFSVDKLGDAMKEFGIRVKDTSTTTTDAFELLGYGAGASAEEIAKTKKEISKLEKELKYAKKEQEGFNDKTSELTRMKNADKIAEYTSELEICRAKLADMTTESGESLGNISDLQDRFAAGGEAAQEATAEVLEAWYAMDDKVAQNAAGVGLFGTMWEDLGIDGIKALTDVEGSIDSTTDALGTMAQVKYDDLGSEFETLKRKIETSMLTPLGQKLTPIVSNLIKTVEKKLPQIQKLCEKLGDVAIKGLEKIEPGLEWLLDDALPILVDLLEFAADNFIELASAIAAAYGACKTLSIITKVGTAIEGVTGAMAAFNAVTSATSLGAIITAVGLLAGGVYLLADAYETEAEKEEKARKELEEYRKKSEEAIEAANERRNEIDKLAEAELAEVEITKDLWAELQTLVDENGKVLEGNEDRVAFIKDKLEGALGIEIDLVDGQIQKYKDLQTEINNTLKAKEASIYFNAAEDKYQDAITKKIDAEKAQLEAYDKLEKLREEIVSEYDRRTAELAAMPNGQDKEIAQQQFEEWIKEDYNSMLIELDKARIDVETANTKLAQCYSDIAQYENAYTMYTKGEYDETIKYLEGINQARITAADIAEETSAQQIEAIKNQVIESGTQMELLRIQLENCAADEKALYERMYKEKEAQFQEDAALYKAAGGTNAQSYIDEITSRMKAYDYNFKDTGLKESASLIEGFNEGLDKKSPEMSSKLQSIVMNMSSIKTDIFSSLGIRMAEGIAQGIEEGEHKPRTAMAKILEGTLKKAIDFAEIHSPSRLFAREVGEYLPSGVGMGIEDNEDAAVDPMRDMIGRMANISNGEVVNNYAHNSSTVNQYGNSATESKLEQLIEAIKSLKIYLNGDTLVGELAPAMDAALGDIATGNERGH